MTIPTRFALPGVLVASGLLLFPAPAAAVPLPDVPELPAALRKVPDGLAAFAHVRFAVVWDHPAARHLRKGYEAEFEEDPEMRDFLRNLDNLDTVTAFLLAKREPTDRARWAFILTTREPYRRPAVLDWLRFPGRNPSPDDPDVVLSPAGVVLYFAGPRVFAVMEESLLEDFRKADRRPGDRLPEPLRLAASGEHALVAWGSRTALPIEAADGLDLLTKLLVQPEYHPLLRADSFLLWLDIGKVNRAQARLVYSNENATRRGEEVARKTRAWFEKELGQDERPHLARRPKLHAVNLLVIDHILLALRTIDINRDGTTVTVSARMEIEEGIGKKIDDAFAEMRQAEPIYRRENNLRQIGLALLNHEATFRHFPPAGARRPGGKPLLSWRVALLPYIEQAVLLQRFKRDEPWDSEHNKKLLGEMPRLFAIPGVNKPGDTRTHYRVFAGNGAAFELAGTRRAADFRDGLSNTILVVEAKEPVEWSRPEPLVYDPEKPLPELLYDADGYTRVLMGDASVRRLKKGVAEKTLRALITRNGGEVVPNEFDE